MLGVDRRSVQNFDWVLAGTVCLLVGAGLLNLVSASHTEVGTSEEVRRQLLALVVGTVALALVVAFDYRHLERLALPLYTISLGLLALTLLIAPATRGGHQAWLLDGRIQPAELAKLGMLLMLARWFARTPPSEVQRLRDLIQPALLIALPVGMIVLQGDMGVALLTLLIGSTYLAFVRIRRRAWLGVALLGAATLAAAWLFVFEPYQRDRILDVMDPGRDPLASGYQVNQSRIAIGSGGLVGKGFQQGTQSQLRFLPTQHTDFAFSVLAEEWGLVGSVTVLSLFAFLQIWALVVARNAKDGFGAMLAVGVAGFLFWPTLLNVGMVLGVAPVIGVPLPFISYGGSALVTSLIAVGILLNVSLRRWVF